VFPFFLSVNFDTVILNNQEVILYTGSCLCGAIQFSIKAELGPVQVCHCLQCRKAQGGPFATNIAVSESVFQLTSGRNLLSEFASSPGKKRCFCTVCGSPVYSYRESLPGVVRIRAGLINEPLAVQPLAHFNLTSQCNWWPEKQ